MNGSKNLFKFSSAAVIAGFAAAAAAGVTHYRSINLQLDEQNELSKIMMKLPSLELAQKMKVIRKQKLLSEQEISAILSFELENRPRLGQARRDSSGFKRIDSNWITHYLHTNAVFQQAQSNRIILERIINTAIDVDEKEGWGLLIGDKKRIKARVIEIHRVNPGGGLVDIKHHDHGSLVTVDIMCSSHKDFTGGDFCTLEADETMKRYEFQLGDALFFPSHKYHCVMPVRGGERVVFVVELWHGEERTCAHRCLQHLGDCNYSVEENRLSILTTSAIPEIDPW